MAAPLPGTRQHQAVLGALVDHYAADPHIRAVSVFGSLGRGDWHALSDLDLDVVVSDGVLLDPADEVRRLEVTFERLGEHIAVVVPRPPDEAKVVLASTHATAVTDAGLRQALQHALDLLEHHLPCFAGPGATLNQEQQIVVTALRARLVE